MRVAGKNGLNKQERTTHQLPDRKSLYLYIELATSHQFNQGCMWINQLVSCSYTPNWYTHQRECIGNCSVEVSQQSKKWVYHVDL